MKWLLIPLFILCGLATAADKYPDFATLAHHEIQDQDFRIYVQDLKARVSIFAIHGGLIEPGSDALAQALTADQHNLYIFEGLKKHNPFDLHITATRFDEPQALKLAQSSQSCVSIHGYIGDGTKAICIGGNDKTLAQNLAYTLKTNNSEFEVIYPCKAYPATNPKNIVNRCLNQGVQLEISQGLWDEFKVNKELEKKVIKILRKEFEQKN